MKDATLVLAGVALGFVVARLLLQPSSCNAYVANAVRTKVGTALGSGAQEVGDALGLWPFASGVVTTLGVQP